MEKHILVSVDDTAQSKEVLRYAASMRSQIEPVRFSLVNVQPAISTYITEEAQRKPSARSALDKIMKENDAASRNVLEAAAQRLVDLGVDQERIETRAYPRNQAVADDLLSIGSAKTVDAILVGRRGNSVLHRWFTGSVTANLIERSEVIPIWLVDGNATSNNILLAADGSASALRALDHLAFMLSDNPEQRIRLFHVQPRFGDYCKLEATDEAAQAGAALVDAGDRGCMDDFHARPWRRSKRTDWTRTGC